MSDSLDSWLEGFSQYKKDFRRDKEGFEKGGEEENYPELFKQYAEGFRDYNVFFVNEIIRILESDKLQEKYDSSSEERKKELEELFQRKREYVLTQNPDYSFSKKTLKHEKSKIQTQAQPLKTESSKDFQQLYSKNYKDYKSLEDELQERMGELKKTNPKSFINIKRFYETNRGVLNAKTEQISAQEYSKDYYKQANKIIKKYINLINGILGDIKNAKPNQTRINVKDSEFLFSDYEDKIKYLQSIAKKPRILEQLLQNTQKEYNEITEKIRRAENKQALKKEYDDFIAKQINKLYAYQSYYKTKNFLENVQKKPVKLEEFLHNLARKESAIQDLKSFKDFVKDKNEKMEKYRTYYRIKEKTQPYRKEENRLKKSFENKPPDNSYRFFFYERMFDIKIPNKTGDKFNYDTLRKHEETLRKELGITEEVFEKKQKKVMKKEYPKLKKLSLSLDLILADYDFKKAAKKEKELKKKFEVFQNLPELKKYSLDKDFNRAVRRISSLRKQGVSEQEIKENFKENLGKINQELEKIIKRLES